MLPPNPSKLILQEYDAQQEVFRALGLRAETLIKQRLAQNNISVHSVSHRCKEKASLARKLQAPHKNYQQLSDITDIIGVRIITYFDEEVDQLAGMIAELFEIDADNSVDKRSLLELNSFGYLSLHFIVSHPAQTCQGEHAAFVGKRFEIQIRSILQHAWAEIEHDLGYKAEDEVSPKIRRRFARVAGLLELADVEFSAIRTELLKREKHQFEQGHASAPLQVESEITLESLRAAYASNRHLRTLDRAIAKVAHARINQENMFVLERTVPRLAFLGITSLAQLEDTARSLLQQAEEFAKLWMAGDSFSTLEIGVGSIYLCYLLVGERQDKQFALDYLNQTSTAGSKLREKMADNILALYRQVAKSGA